LKKDSIDNENEKLSFGASSMQGWRIDQEVWHLRYFPILSLIYDSIARTPTTPY
jgi:hypothetical protein